MKRFLSFIICLLFPVRYTYWFLNLLGHKVNSKANIGFSIIWVTKLQMNQNSRIGHFNLIFVNKIEMDFGSYIGRLNFLKGSFSVLFKNDSAIGNNCIISRAPLGISYGNSQLSLGVLSKLTSGHKLDMMRSISIGDYSTIAGIRSQFWTHGYLHAPTGSDRIRIDGEINIGNNVYIGSSCVINAGIFVADSITIGSNSCVSKNLIKPGMYVAQPLRHIEKDFDETKNKLKRIDWDGLVEEAYEKPSNG